MLGLFQLIASDVRAKADWMYNSQSRRTLLKTLVADGTPTMLMYRCMQASHKNKLVPLAMLFNRLISWFGQCNIGRNADFGPAFVIPYSFGVGVGGHVVGGSHVVLMPQCILAEHFVDTAKRGRKETKCCAPVLGDHVYVGIGARIIGPVKIGSHTKIGANSVVFGDVPDGASVLGVPAQIIWQKAVPPST